MYIGQVNCRRYRLVKVLIRKRCHVYGGRCKDKALEKCNLMKILKDRRNDSISLFSYKRDHLWLNLKLYIYMCADIHVRLGWNDVTETTVQIVTMTSHDNEYRRYLTTRGCHNNTSPWQPYCYY